jgi:hypothetical protein
MMSSAVAGFQAIPGTSVGRTGRWASRERSKCWFPIVIQRSEALVGDDSITGVERS